MKKELIVQVICYYFLLLFAYAALSKLFMYPTFVRDLARAPITREAPMLISILLPAVELSIAVMVVSRRFRKSGLLASFLLMLSFSFYVGYVLKMTDERPCSCGGIFRNITWQSHFIFNVITTIAGFVGYLLATRHQTNSHSRAMEFSS